MVGTKEQATQQSSDINYSNTATMKIIIYYYSSLL